MTDALRRLLRRAELQYAAPVSAQEARRWGRGAVERFVDLGLLRPTTPATTIRYEGCDHGCTIEPEIITHAVTGERFGVHRCMQDECGLVRIPLDELRRWEFDLVGAARTVARAIDLGGQVIEDVPGRFVEAGRVVAGETWRDLFLARGLAWDDATTALADARRLKAAAAPLVFALAMLPTQPVWPDCKPAVALLADIATLDDRGLGLDLEGVIERPTRPHADAAENKWITVTAAAQLLLSDVSGITLVQAKARISKAANAGKFATNGKHQQDRRIDRDSFSTWRLQQREKDLAAYD